MGLCLYFSRSLYLTPDFSPCAPWQPAEYEKLGSYAMIGLPEQEYPER